MRHLSGLQLTRYEFLTCTNDDMLSLIVHKPKTVLSYVQGVLFNVFLHPSRALTELKQIETRT